MNTNERERENERENERDMVITIGGEQYVTLKQYARTREYDAAMLRRHCRKPLKTTRCYVNGIETPMAIVTRKWVKTWLVRIDAEIEIPLSKQRKQKFPGERYIIYITDDNPINVARGIAHDNTNVVVYDPRDKNVVGAK